MGADEIIGLAVTGLELLTKAIAAANAGDLETAQASLKAARDHYAKASEAWDNAGDPRA